MIEDTTETNEVLASALRYAEKGWHIIPVHAITSSGRCTCGNDCKTPGKHPRIKNWQNMASCNEEVIQSWFEQWPNSNIGVVTGNKSGIVILDIDPRHNGNESLQELQSKYGILPNTLESKTGGGGFHKYFSHPNGNTVIRNKVRWLGYNGIDVRGDAGFIVVPPSKHESGNQYDWKSEANTEISPMPDWMAQLLIEGKKAEAKDNAHSNNNGPDWISKALNELRDGNRNDTFCRLIGRFIHNHFLIDDVIALLTPHAEKIGFSTDELESEIIGLYARYDNSTSQHPIYESGEVEKEVVHFADKEEPGPRKYLIAGLIPLNHITLLYGAGGQGKSFMGLRVAVSVAMGTSFVGCEAKKDNVLYVDFELDETEQLRRAFEVSRGAGLSKPPDGLYYYRANSSLLNILEQLKGIIAANNIGLVIIDSLGPACGVDPEVAKFVMGPPV